LIAATRMGLSDMKMRSLLNNDTGSLNFEFDAGLESKKAIPMLALFCNRI
jgi:hypothetical protein